MRPPHRAARLGLGLGTVLAAVLAMVIGPAAGLTPQPEDPVVQALEAQLRVGEQVVHRARHAGGARGSRARTATSI